MTAEHKIKELKRPGGLKYIFKKDSAMVQYSNTLHITGDWATQIKERAHPKNKGKGVQMHKDEGKSAMVQDDSNVCKLVDHINNHMQNPFSTDSDIPDILINISTGMHVTPEVAISSTFY